METTLLKGLSLLDTLTTGGAWGVSELATALGMSKSNVHRLLNTLVEAGFADMRGGKYAASLKCWELGNRVIRRYDVRKATIHLMEHLAAETAENVRLTILDPAALEIIYVENIESSQPVRTFTDVGGRRAAYCCASGKLLLAFQDTPVVEAACRALRRLTKQTITDPAVFMSELENIRHAGFAVNRGERTEQVRGIAAPVRRGDSAVVAAISIAAPADRLTDAIIPDFVSKLCGAAASASLALSRGHSGLPEFLQVPRTNIVEPRTRRTDGATRKVA